MATVDDDHALQDALAAALAACRNVLADYRAGLLDEAELRGALLTVGFVQRGDEAWQLDIDGETWHRWVRRPAPGRAGEVG